MESRCISIDCETVRSPFDHLSITSRSIVFDHGHDCISLFIYNIVRIDRRNRDVSRLIGSVRSSFGSSFLIVTFLYNNVIAIAFYNRFSIDRQKPSLQAAQRVDRRNREYLEEFDHLRSSFDRNLSSRVA